MDNTDKFIEQDNDTDAIVYRAFCNAQKEFKPLLNNSKNSAFKNSSYADITACITAVRDALNKNGFALTQSTALTEHGIKVETILMHECGGLLVLGDMVIPVLKKDAHGFASAVTYARRYSLMLSFGLGGEDDDGNISIQGGDNTDGGFVSPKGLRHSPLGDPWEFVPANQHQYLEDLAEELKAIFDNEGGQATKEKYTKENLDNDQKTAIWSKLPPNIRSAIKKEYT